MEVKMRTSQSTDNFWKAWSEPLLDPLPIFYRLYYDNNGFPITYSMEDLPGEWIEIDQTTYLIGSHHVKVVDKKIIYQTPGWRNQKLKPNSVSGTCCHPNNVCVVVDAELDHTKWNLQ
jgi:hypothetical protein